MKMFRVFQRIPAPTLEMLGNAETEDLRPWLERMDQLLLSDPKETLSFVSDAIMAVAAQLDCDDAWEKVMASIEEATLGDERDQVIKIVRKRLNQLLAVATERTDATRPEAMRAFWHNAARAPWPED